MVRRWRKGHAGTAGPLVRGRWRSGGVRSSLHVLGATICPILMFRPWRTCIVAPTVPRYLSPAQRAGLKNGLPLAEGACRNGGVRSSLHVLHATICPILMLRPWRTCIVAPTVPRYLSPAQRAGFTWVQIDSGLKGRDLRIARRRVADRNPSGRVTHPRLAPYARTSAQRTHCPARAAMNFHHEEQEGHEGNGFKKD